ncbi:LOW QUALITY PROTEIN: uncharacterized protein LOC119614105 [Lucilia sericata]|uniref:LOW QUALITY PROTEIN: uncharacterized protein LOC119614105 n=1 Tax=Lucilia sericata TaxID=13632 RepID=UPI0018A827E8|nr:LOW QUALITY PROTEIN: uncharacterized protein LOC119614105 [Lucilia sericata]
MPLFGKDFHNDWPTYDFDKHLTPFGQDLIQKCLDIEKPKEQLVDIQEFMQKSNEFPIKFPIDSCRIKSQPVECHVDIQRQIASAYPLMHEKVLYLIVDFLEHKLKYGSTIEKQLYKDMTITEFVQRLLTKRCISFVGFHDSYILITGETGHGEKYLKIGTEAEEEPLVLANVLSYDEIKISALLSVASHSDFINDGRRHNGGKIEKDYEKIERQGVVVGIIGARFARPFRMEYEDIIICKEQNITEMGYGCHGTTTEGDLKDPTTLWQYLLPIKKTEQLEKLQDYRKVWQKFYEESDHLYKKVSLDNKRFGECYKPEAIFDNLMMKKRFALPFDLLLLEANARALKVQKLAYIHVVGIGLGVWLAAPQQEQIFLACFQQRLKYLLPQLNNIGVLHFSWFKSQEWQDLKNESIIKSATHSQGGIKILISNRNPNEKLTSPYEGMLPVVSFAWDGNSLPGNEFWMGSLVSSNDPSAACSTLITELFNPHINTKYVNGNNLYLASPKYGIIHIKDYVEKILS